MRDQCWQDELLSIVEKKGVSIIHFDDEGWESILQSKRGSEEFTIAKPHHSFDKIKTKSLCLVAAKGRSTELQLYIGVLSTKQAITTLDTRIKVRRTQLISPDNYRNLHELVGFKIPKDIPETFVQRLTRSQSNEFVQGLLSIFENEGSFQKVLSVLKGRDSRELNKSLQLDAVQTVLRSFDMEVDAPASFLDSGENLDTVLDGINIQEANVILHDSRIFPEFKLESSDVTGRAIFIRGNEKIEIITANALPLEEVFGVDLIYLNRTSQSLVMVQYKMLEKTQKSSMTMWRHRVDPKFQDEIKRMKRFSKTNGVNDSEYRLNNGAFYLKFVKRNRVDGTSGIILPLEHFELLLSRNQLEGERGGLRLDYESLSGQYLRQTAFIELIRSGYIGCQPKTTKEMDRLITFITSNGKSAVIAIRSNFTEK